MNKDQRNANRLNGRTLADLAKKRRLAEHVCENCGEKGGHWVSLPVSLQEMIAEGILQRGFYTCAGKEPANTVIEDKR